MVAEAWILKMGNQVSSNLKQALLVEPHKHKHKHKHKNLNTIGILSFEVANVMSKTVHLYKSLTHSEVSRLKLDIFKSQGVNNLVSTDETYLLQLALAEKLDDLNRVATIVSRLGKKCAEPALQGFEHVYGDIVSGVIDVKQLGFLVKDMEGMVRKMERYVNATSNLYAEMEVLNELEQATKKFQHEESRRAFEQKLVWQKQDVRHLKEISLWNQTYDKVVELLARTVCTLYAKICSVFGESLLKKESIEDTGGSSSSSSSKDESEFSSQIIGSGLLKRDTSRTSSHGFQLRKEMSIKPKVYSRRGEEAVFRTEEVVFPCVTSPGRLFMDCLSLSSSASKLENDEDDIVIDNDDRSSQISGCCSTANGGMKRERPSITGFSNRTTSGFSCGGDQRQPRFNVINAYFNCKSRLTVRAPPSTIGGSALALRYANVIIILEKLLRYPHLVGDEARDDLYQMLPTSLRMSLRINLKSYVKNLAIYDAPLAHDWKDTLDGILSWLAPLAHNMIRWQSERNFEQHQIVKRTNVLLLQTLYFADRVKTEGAICELLVGLNYICRYEHQQNALLDCASSFDFEDCMQWQLQCRAAFAE
ncbi:protein PSK SIMULATOR 1 [Mercurialis annua]|uniref:protein PSK SIMULATOR 1 n=1 Tax=Mercurialis annua TaxID=3986 RepID=UPI00215DE561|nr:protein PSK SIMULATOR 1 [Mercurialis annua]XP_050218962.1 protein PSK SIMULATOR 1 [Mercurialis annua]